MPQFAKIAEAILEDMDIQMPVMDGHLAKPIDVEQLKATMSEFLL